MLVFPHLGARAMVRQTSFSRLFEALHGRGRRAMQSLANTFDDEVADAWRAELSEED